jgi:hypothetical protein
VFLYVVHVFDEIKYLSTQRNDELAKQPTESMGSSEELLRNCKISLCLDFVLEIYL